MPFSKIRNSPAPIRATRIRQGIPFIGGGGVGLTQANGVLADLRSSKDEGQSNFTNPGIELLGLGADFDILPQLRLSTNANYLRFVTTAPLEFLRTSPTSPTISATTSHSP